MWRWLKNNICTTEDTVGGVIWIATLAFLLRILCVFVVGLAFYFYQRVQRGDDFLIIWFKNHLFLKVV
jgi:hypothetical protein